MRKLSQILIFILIASLSAILTLVTLTYTILMRFVTRSKRNRDLGKKIRLLTERMGVPPSIHNKIMITEERIKENAKLYNFNHSWEESMAVVTSNFYEENFCSSEPYSTLKELCKKA